MAIDVIKEYLVSLGFDVDQKSFNEANKAMDSMEKVISKFKKGFAENEHMKKFAATFQEVIDKIGGWISKFVLSTKGLVLGAITAIGVAFTALAVIITSALNKFMQSMAKADMQLQVFAQRMFLTVDNARSLKAVMDAMGLENMDQLKDVALNPELRSQFLELRKLTEGLTIGSDVQEGMKNIRALNFEFQKLSVVMNYFWTMLAGKLGKVLEGPLRDIGTLVERLMSALVRVLPNLTEGLARVAGIFYKLVSIAFKLVSMVVGLPAIGKMFEQWLEGMSGALAIVDELLGAVDRLLSKFLGMPTSDKSGKDSSDIYRTKEDDMRSAAYYVRKIFELLSSVWTFLLSWTRPLRQWMSKNLGWIFGGEAEAATADTTASSSQSPTKPQKTVPGRGGKHLLWNTRDKSSDAINNFINNLEGKLQGVYNITAAKATTGHVSHGKGTALDIGLAGKNDSQIVSLMKAVLNTPGLKIANLELSTAHYSKILKALDQQGVDYKGRVSNNKSKYSHGDHLHVGVQPVVQEISIQINGKDGPTIARQLKEFFQDEASRIIRTNRGINA